MVKKKIPWMILFLVIAGLSIWTITSRSKDFTLSYLETELRYIKIPWLIGAIISMLGYIVFEGLAVAFLARGLDGHKKNHYGLVYGAADVYFSAITPSATGGQPASAFFMMWDGISGPKTAVILLVNLIMYTFALLTCGAIVLITRFEIFLELTLVSRILIVVGTAFMATLGIGFILLLKKEEWIRSIGTAAIHCGTKLHLVRHPEVRIHKLDDKIHQYRECAQAIRGKGKLLWLAFLMNLLQRISQSMVTPLMYVALGGITGYMYNAWSIQILASLGSNTVPIPGAMGVADVLLLDGLSQIRFLPMVSSVSNLELLSRGLSFYVCVFVSLIILIVGYLRRIRNQKQGDR